MNPPLETRPRQRRYRVRRQARLDAETHAKLETLAATFHRRRAAILRYVMQWGLAHTTEWTVDPSIPDRPPLVHMLVDPELLQRVQDAADAHGANVAAWLRHALRQVTQEDFPDSWRAAEPAGRSHASGHYQRRFRSWLEERTSTTLTTLTQTFHRSAAEIIRQRIAQACPGDFPPSWYLANQECRASQARRDGTDTREATRA